MRTLRHALALVLTASMLLLPIGAANADDGDTTATETTSTPPPSDPPAAEETPATTPPPADEPAETPPAPPADETEPPAEDEGTTGDDTTDSPPPAEDPNDEGSSDEGTPDQNAGDEGTADEKSTGDDTADASAKLAVPQTLSVGPLAVAPTALCEACDDTYTTTERTLLIGNVFDNDESSPWQLFGFDVVSGPTKGTIVHPAGGGFVYTPDPDATGTDTFTYTYTTGGFLNSHTSNVATVTINITGAPPQTANNDTYYVEAGDTLTVNGPGVFGNDDSQLHIAFDVEDGVDNGTFSQLSSFFGGFKYTPTPGFTGTGTFTYHYYHLPTLSASSTATVNIVVYEKPELSSDYYETDMDTALTVPADGLLDNDSDGPINDLAAFNVYGGTVDELNADGSFTFTPESGFYGWAGFQYKASYGDPTDGLVSDPAWVDIWVNDTRLPTIVDDTYTINQGETLNVPAPGPLGNDIFPSGTDWELEDCTQPAHATVTCAPDGTLTVVPDEGFSGALTFTYEVVKKHIAVGSLGVTPSGVVAPAASTVGTVGSITVNVLAPTPPAADPGDDADDAQLLPDTGAPVNPWLLALAAGMVAAGVGLVLRPRRRS